MAHDRSFKRRRTLVATGAALCLVVLSGCQNSEDFSDIPPIVVTPEFAPQSTAGAASDFVTLEERLVAANTITLDVVINEVADPVSGIVLTLSYPDQIGNFVRCVDGDLLPPGTCFASEGSTGEVTIGRSITAPEVPVPVNGARAIVRLEFFVFLPGEGDIVFEAKNLGGGDATALLDANGDPILVSWFAGKLLGS